MKVQFLNPTINEDDCQAALQVMRSGWLVLQKETEKFEAAFAEYLGTKHAVLTSSCTNSLHLSLIIAGISQGDEVITTPLSYVSSTNPILHCGAKPVFVDVEPETGLLDINQVESAITDKTKAIILVHLYGQMANMKSFKKLADKYNLIIIEDAAHSIEAEREGIQPATLGFSACFSFHVAKNITAGTGGALATNDLAVAERAKILRRDGVRNVGNSRQMEALGNKYLSTDFQAAMLISQLERINQMWQRRHELYNRYAQAFNKLGIAFNQVAPNSRNAHHMIVIWVDPLHRDLIRQALFDQGIQTSIHYNAIHLEPFYRKAFGFQEGCFPVAERLGASTITLPMYPNLSNEEQDYVIQQVSQLVIPQAKQREIFYVSNV